MPCRHAENIQLQFTANGDVPADNFAERLMFIREINLRASV